MSDEAKKRKREHDKERARTKVNIGPAHTRWRELKEATKCKQMLLRNLCYHHSVSLTEQLHKESDKHRQSYRKVNTNGKLVVRELTQRQRPANSVPIPELDMARLDVVETFQGILFPGHLHTQDSLQHALKFPFQDTDIIIVSYPKSGTTWMQEIVTLISNRGDPHVSQTVPNWARAPWLEQLYFTAILNASTTSPRLITTHLPHHLLGPGLKGSKAKIIYVSRNPKDVVVSFYHFHKMANFLPDAGSFPDFLNRFLEGTVSYGSWFDHIKGWTSQTATMNNLLHITYEEMILDLHGSIKRLSSYLQSPLLEDEVNNCVKQCSFNCMKDNTMANYTLITEDIIDHKKGSFMRKGKIGDWKNMFTEEQNQHFRSVFKSKMEDCTLEFVWEDQHNEETSY